MLPNAQQQDIKHLRREKPNAFTAISPAAQDRKEQLDGRVLNPALGSDRYHCVARRRGTERVETRAELVNFA